MLGSLPRRIAALRALVLPLAIGGELLTHQSAGGPRGFTEAIVVAAIYAMGTLAWSWRRHTLSRHEWAGLVSADLAAAGALVYFTGGAASDLRFALMIVPLVAASVGSLRGGLASLAGACVVFAAAAALHPQAQASLVIAHLALLVWVGALLLVVAWVVGQRQVRLVALIEQREALVDRARSAESREREKLALALHDDALQSLLAAQLQLGRGSAEGRVEAATAVERAIGSLRATVADLYPRDSADPTLEESIRAVAADRGELAGFEVETSIGAIPESHRETLYAIARELITNAAKHAHASRVTVAARVDEGASVLQVRDDGRGFERDALDRPRRGHIGLVAVRERIARLGGGLEILSAPGQGALITVWIPLDHHEYAERLEHPTPVWRAPLHETPPSADAA